MTLLPLRTVFESVGATVSWDDLTKSVKVTKDGQEMNLSIGSNKIYVNGQEQKLDIDAQLINDTTMVHIRAVEFLNMSVNWDGESSTISIKN